MMRMLGTVVAVTADVGLETDQTSVVNIHHQRVTEPLQTHTNNVVIYLSLHISALEKTQVFLEKVFSFV